MPWIFEPIKLTATAKDATWADATAAKLVVGATGQFTLSIGEGSRYVELKAPTADTDWSHLILGGWDVDTSKRVVEKDVEAFLGEFKITGLQRHAVFGPRYSSGTPLSSRCPRVDCKISIV